VEKENGFRELIERKSGLVRNLGTNMLMWE
jgi:hypothetical protein